MHKTAYTLLTLCTAAVLITGCSSQQESTPSPQEQQTQPAKVVNAVGAVDKPTLKMDVKVDGKQATINFNTTNFKISQEHYSHDHIAGEGHIHLFVDGSLTKIPVKESTYTLADLTPGKHKIIAALHTNNHQPYNVEQSAEFEVK